MTGPDTGNFENGSNDLLSCDAITHRILSYLEGHLSSSEMERMRHHFANCPSCAEHTVVVRELRRSLKSVPAHRPPAHLHANLQVMASREAARRRTVRTALERWS